MIVLDEAGLRWIREVPSAASRRAHGLNFSIARRSSSETGDRELVPVCIYRIEVARKAIPEEDPSSMSECA